MSDSKNNPQELSSKVTADWNDGDKLFSHGKDHFFSGKLAEAAAIFMRLLEISPNHSGAETFLIGALIAENRFQEAEKVLTNFLKREPNSSFAHGAAAKVLYRSGEPEKALESVRKSIACDPNNLNSLRMFYHHFRERNQATDALAELESFANKFPSSWGSCYIIAGHYQLHNSPDESLFWMKRGLENSPVNPDLLKALTGLLGQLGKYDELIDTVEAARAIGEIGLGAKFNLLQAYLQTGNKDSASQLLTELRHEAPPSWSNILDHFDRQLQA